MNEDGPSVPKTLPYVGPLPQLGPWFDSSKNIVERAAALKGLSLARGRIGVFQTLVGELSRRETDTTTTTADLFEAAFDDRSGVAFWRARLSLMTNREEFIAMLLPHLTAENSNRSLNQLLLDDLVSRDLPASGLLREQTFDPLPVVKWIGAREVYHDMLPTSLLAFLRGDAEQLKRNKSIAPPAIGRPSGTSYDVLDKPFVERIASMVRNGEMSSVAAAARAVVGDGARIPGGGEAESKADRLRRKATKALKSGE